jgi:hypothetical protein
MRIPLLRAGLLIYIRPWFNAFKTFKSFKSIPDSSQRLERFERSVAIERLEPGISLDSEEAMLTEEQNQQLTRVGPRTPVGELSPLLASCSCGLPNERAGTRSK